MIAVESGIIPATRIRVVHDIERTGSLRELAGHFGAGRLTARIAETYPIDRVREAHSRLAAGGVRGRLVLVF